MNSQPDSNELIDRFSVKRIFILRPDNLGDLILFTGAFRILKNHFSNAHITLCIKKYAVNLLEACPHVDEIIPWESLMHTRLDSFPEFKGRWRLGKLLQKNKISRLCRSSNGFDLFLLPIRNTTYDMHWFAHKFKAAQKFSIADQSHDYAYYDASQIYTNKLYVKKNKASACETTITRRFLEMLGLTVEKTDLYPEIFTTSGEKLWANRYIKRIPGTVHIAICPGVTSQPDKFYSAENYPEIFSGFTNQTFSVSIFGSTSEADQCKRVENALKNHPQIATVQNFSGKTTIRQLAEAFKQCDFVLSNETGALHLATALNIPTIGIVGGGHFGRFYPWGTPEINLTAYKPMACFNCEWDCIYDEKKCIHEIHPGFITNLIKRILTTIHSKNLR